MSLYWKTLVEEVLDQKSTRYFAPSKPKKTRSVRAKAPKSKKNEKIMYKLGDQFGELYFTKREAECMVHLLRGQSIKSIAEALKLSPRTVEFYIKNMKQKVGCRTKFELVDIILESQFMQNVDF